MIFQDLTDEQKALVEAPIGNICCFAVAGSGKTESLAFRSARLLNEGMDPNRILLITFSNKAALEMSRRVNYLLGDDIFISNTFHSFGMRLTQEFYELLGLKKGPQLIERKQSLEYFFNIRKEICEKTRIRGIPKNNVLFEIYCGSINHNTSFEKYIEKYYRIFQAEQISVIKEIFKAYIELKKEKNLIDFEDLLLNTYDLLSNNEIRKEIASRYDSIMVDEYQDINWIQHDIIRFLNVKNNTLIIGDRNQTIYTWRGSNDRYIESFANEFDNVSIFYLTTNFRSTQEILNFAENSINHNPQPKPVKLVSYHKIGSRPVIISAETIDDLYSAVASDIVANGAANYNKTAVLVRFNADCSSCKKVFDTIGVPSITDYGIFLTSTKYFKDIKAFLSFLWDVNDDISLRSSLKFIGIIGKRQEEFLKRFNACGRNLKTVDTSFDAIIEKRYNKFKDLFLKEELTIDQQIKRFRDNYYSEYVYKTLTNSEQAFEDIEHIILQSTNFATFSDFINYYAINNDQETDKGNKVSIVTVHKAKGLEWDVVYVLGLNEDYFPKRNENFQNERKLFYVACTRAKDDLIVGFSKTDTQRKPASPSRFIEEIHQNLYTYQAL